MIYKMIGGPKDITNSCPTPTSFHVIYLNDLNLLLKWG